MTLSYGHVHSTEVVQDADAIAKSHISIFVHTEDVILCVMHESSA